MFWPHAFYLKRYGKEFTCSFLIQIIDYVYSKPIICFLLLLHCSQQSPTTDSQHTTESDFLNNLCLKAPAARGNSVDEWWTQLNDKVSGKLHICATLGHLQPKKKEPCWTKSTNQVVHWFYPTKERPFGSN